MPLRRLFSDTIIYGGGDFLAKAIAFFTFPVVATVLVPSDFGVLELVLTAVMLFGVIVNCGLNNALHRFYWDSTIPENLKSTLVSTGLVTLVLFSFIGMAATIFLVNVWFYFNDNDYGLSVIGITAAISLIFLMQSYRYILDVLRLHFSPFRFLLLTLSTKGLSAVAALIAVVVFTSGVNGYLAAQAGVLFLILPLAIVSIKKDIVFKFDRGYCKELVGYGYPYVFAGMAYWVFGSIDRWMLVSMTSLSEVGTYSVSSRLASIVLFVSAAFGMAWSPMAIKIKEEDPVGYRETYATVLLVLFYMMLLIGGGLALFGGEIIYFLMPSEYHGSALPLAILCFGIVLQSTQQVTAIGISLEKKTHVFAWLAWLTALINFLFNLWLIPSYGATGAAWATLLSYFVLTVSYLFFTQRLHKLPINWMLLSFLMSVAVCLAFLSLLMSSVSFDMDMVFYKLLIVVVCCVIGLWILPIKELKNA